MARSFRYMFAPWWDVKVSPPSRPSIAKGQFASTQNGAVADPPAARGADEKCDVRLGRADGRHRDVAAEVRIAFLVEFDEWRVDENRVAAGRAAIRVANERSLDLRHRAGVA